MQIELGKANEIEQKLMCQPRKQERKVHSWKLETHISFYKYFRFFKLDAHKAYEE
jgi:hypothetical protein